TNYESRITGGSPPRVPPPGGKKNESQDDGHDNPPSSTGRGCHFGQASQHAADILELAPQGLDVWEIAQVLRENEVILQLLGGRCSHVVETGLVVAATPAVAFGDIRRDRGGRPSHLNRKAETLNDWKAAGQRVDRKRDLVGLLPDIQLREGRRHR